MEIVRPPILETVPISGPVSVAIREFKLDAFTYPWHRHPEVELTWILEGGGLRYVGDSVEPFQAGDFCLLGAHLPHAWLSLKNAAPGRVRSLVVQFDPARLGAGLLHLPELAGIARLLQRAAHGLSFDQKCGQWLRRKLTSRATSLLQFTALLEILDELAMHPDARPLSLAPWTVDRRAASDPRFRRVLAYLGDHVGGPIAQAEVARLVGLSPAAFSRFFQRAMGKTFQSYVTDLRLSMACRQLLETDRTVSEVAYAAGFGNLSNFNRSFRQRRGMAPREFRRLSMRSVPEARNAVDL